MRATVVIADITYLSEEQRRTSSAAETEMSM
jgi:hypothetical protein